MQIELTFLEKLGTNIFTICFQNLANFFSKDKDYKNKLYIYIYIYIPILVKFCNKKRAKMGLNMGGAGGLFCISFKNLFGQVVKIYPQFNVKFA
jgi:hypothetical protein